MVLVNSLAFYFLSTSFIDIYGVPLGQPIIKQIHRHPFRVRIFHIHFMG